MPSIIHTVQETIVPKLLFIIIQFRGMLSHWLSIADSPTADLYVDRVLIQGFEPLNSTPDQEAPRSPKGREATLVHGTTVRSSKAKSST